MSQRTLTWGIALLILAGITAVLVVFLMQGDGPPEYFAAWGKQGHEDGEMVTPAGVAVDSSGNVYVLDTGNDRIHRYLATGKYDSHFGHPGSGSEQGGEFDGPMRLQFDHQDNLWVSDTNNNRLQVFDSKTRFIAEVGSLGQDPGQFSHPGGIAFDSSGNFWVADTGNNRIQKFGPGGKNVLAIIPEDNSVEPSDMKNYFNQPYSLCCDPLGTVYVADTFNNRIQKFTSAGAFQSQFGGHGSGPGQFIHPTDVLVDREQNLYVVDSGNNRIQKFNQAWDFICQWGGEGDAARQFRNPQQMAEAPDGTLYIADAGNNRVQVYKPRKANLFNKVEPFAAPNRPRAPVPTGVPLNSPSATGTPHPRRSARSGRSPGIQSPATPAAVPTTHPTPTPTSTFVSPAPLPTTSPAPSSSATPGDAAPTALPTKF
jgi:sugar lactone lactonase YvrE